MERLAEAGIEPSVGSVAKEPYVVNEMCRK
jgi:hypothetical protein